MVNLTEREKLYLQNLGRNSDVSILLGIYDKMIDSVKDDVIEGKLTGPEAKTVIALVKNLKSAIAILGEDNFIPSRNPAM